MFDISKVVDSLSDKDSYLPVYHGMNFHDVPMPSTAVLSKIVDLLKAVLFPGFFMNTEIKPETMKYYIGSALDEANAFSTSRSNWVMLSCKEEDRWNVWSMNRSTGKRPTGSYPLCLISGGCSPRHAGSLRGRSGGYQRGRSHLLLSEPDRHNEP